MSKLMSVLGIILAAAGVAMVVMGLVNRVPLQAWGLDMNSALNLIVGGILAVGLGGVIGALKAGAATVSHESEAASADTVAPVSITEEKPGEEEAAERPVRFPSFARKVEEAAIPPIAVATTVSTSKYSEEIVTPAVKETITALEQAKTDLEAAMGSTESASSAGEGELYVVEDKVVRGRPARILSDGTVEAETDEGWMRFENLEHLDEYLDAVEQA
jgi:hypothetical protein